MKRRVADIIRCMAMLMLFLCFALQVQAQDTLSLPIPKARLHREMATKMLKDSLKVSANAGVLGDSTGVPLQQKNDTLSALIQNADSLTALALEAVDSLTRLARELSDSAIDTVHIVQQVQEMDIDKIHWMPNPKKALWLGIVFPGGGQIYNRKYWKLPLFYGGFIGCVYAINWNNTMYRDYSQAYIDIMDDDPNTKSYENFIPRSYDINANTARLQELFRKKKDFYRRYRDLSIFCVIGVYALSVLDAYIDAELSSFDISKDLSMKVRPSIINEHRTALRTPNLMNTSYGVQCSFSF